MKFAHLSDTHLGYRQYGLNEREKDFYEVFEKIIDKIIEEDVDFVIHSGDLFETAKPSPNALLAFQKGLLRLKGAGIPMYAIAGNHDSVMRKDAIPPQVLFKKFGLKVISPINTNYMQGDIFIAGLPYYPSSQNKNLKEKLAELSQKAENHEKSILVLHQGIDKYLPFHNELEIGDIPDNFDYYAFGHIHKYIEDNFGKGKLVYPGSTEIWKADEIEDLRRNGKGFVVVDMSGPKVEVKRVPISVSREFITKNIDFNELSKEIDSLKAIIKDFDKKPILNLTIYNVEGNTKDIYNFINDELGDYALMIRPDFKMKDEVFDLDILIEQNKSLGPRELLIDELKEYGNQNMTRLGVDLYEALSRDNQDESSKLINEYYDENYEGMVVDNVKETKEPVVKDGQVRFKEAL